MGFLLGAYGKLMAGKRVRQLQARMMHVQSQMRRVTREVADMEKQIQAQEKSMKNSIKQMASVFNMGLQSAASASLESMRSSMLNQFIDPETKAITKGKETEFNTNLQLFQQQSAGLAQANSFIQQITQASVAQMEQTIDAQIEMMKELQLEPLKDLEDELQTEKDSLESQVQIAQADYEACKEMEKAGAKNLAPNYTGQS